MSDTYRYNKDNYDDDPRNFLGQQQKKNKKKSKDKKALGYFQKFNTGNCVINNAIFNSSTKAGLDMNGGTIEGAIQGTLDPGCGGTVGGAPAGGCPAGGTTGGAAGGCGESLKNRGMENMKTLKEEDEEKKILSDIEDIALDTEWIASQSYVSDDGKTLLFRYVLAEPTVSDDLLDEINKYSNVIYNEKGATSKNDPEVTYATICFTLPNEDNEYEEDDEEDDEEDEEIEEEYDVYGMDKWMEQYNQYGDDDLKDIDDEEEDDLEILTEIDDEELDEEYFKGIYNDLEDPIFEEKETERIPTMYDDLEEPEYVNVYKSSNKSPYSDQYLVDESKDDYISELTVIDQKPLKNHKRPHTLMLYQSGHTGIYYTVVVGSGSDIIDEEQLMDEANGEFDDLNKAMDFFENYE